MVTIANQLMKIVVDADACPVKAEVVSIAKQFVVDVMMVASFDHYLPPTDGITVVQVDRSDQSADMYIANRIVPHDILVTQDFGLAAIGLSKGARVLSNRGQVYTNENIDFLLERRHQGAKHRRSGRFGKGPKPFTNADRNNFLQTLTKVLSGLQENRLM